jgi:predicted  nucleic acid-binding Zn-ribbon protein
MSNCHQNQEKLNSWDWKEVEQLKDNYLGLKDNFMGLQQHIREQGKHLQSLSERLSIQESQLSGLQMDLRSFVSASMSHNRPVSSTFSYHKYSPL